MSDLATKVQTYLEIYDPLGMGELADVSTLYGPVAAEVAGVVERSVGPEEVTEGVHKVLFLTYGTQAGHVRNYGDLGKDLWKLKAG